MMSDRGHDVVLYSGEENEARCKEHVPCIDLAMQRACGFNGPADYNKVRWENSTPYFTEFSRNVISNLRERVKQKDLILITANWVGNPIFDAFPWPQHQVVEYGIGYKYTTARYLVFESHAWRNYIYGRGGIDGEFFHEVIPNFYPADEFPLGGGGDYFLFVGRLNVDKGVQIAVEVCKRLGVRLVIAGPGDPPDEYGEYVGMVGPDERTRLMAGARAAFVPTLYVGPFEGVHAEAQLCGTPVITTDWGVFTETVQNGVNGYRCKMFKDFVAGAQAVGELDRTAIRNAARSRYAYDAIAPQYEEYFARLLTLWGDGFYTF
jgi:glycosyltransferase involved in cell wall biosynthesis